MNLDEICLTCGYPRGEHGQEQLRWIMHDGGTARDVEFWQDDICPFMHNWTQPPWDIYLFRGKDWYAVSKQPEWSK
jgi:hypothetical protein